jgi:hypothetical protein
MPVELHPQLRRYAEARAAFLQAKRDLQSAKGGVYWWKIENAPQGL